MKLLATLFFLRYNVYSLLNIEIHDSDIDNYCLKIVTIAQNCCHLFFSCLNFFKVLSRPKYFGRQCDINDIQL
jgi:hypothetical protein